MPPAKKIQKFSQRVGDKFGNFLTIMENGNVFLKLIGMKGKSILGRRIGFIDREKKIFIAPRKREKHLMRKFNAYGFNDRLLRSAKSFTHILLQDEYGEYLFPVADLFTYGKCYLHFKQQGFELQIFLALEHIQRYKSQQ